MMIGVHDIFIIFVNTKENESVRADGIASVGDGGSASRQGGIPTCLLGPRRSPPCLESESQDSRHNSITDLHYCWEHGRMNTRYCTLDTSNITPLL